MVKLSKQIKFKTENFKINYGLSTNTNKSSFINICGWCSLNNVDDLSSKDLDNEFKELKKSIKRELQNSLNDSKSNVNIFNKNNFILDIEIKETSIKERKFGFSTIEIILNNLNSYDNLIVDNYKFSIERIIDNIIDNCLLYSDNKLFKYTVKKPIIK